MDDLVQFLKKRLAEDEAIAAAPTKATWATAEWRFAEVAGDPIVDLGTNQLTRVSSLNKQEMQHIARHDPARVLAEVSAKRELLNRYEYPEASEALPPSMNRLTASVERAVLDLAFRYLALPYADHPDYRGTWRP
ncbi:DUF6221 family protein (plasmid) [Streptomyces anulatus]|uniref:DUF6221 family protein n=1 Tax=Streptomyces anulatus TaxID=1892 RepID=A0ABZ1ZWK4_STRAQ|nr:MULTISPECIES: DUF6221 family protein [Streptomyces]WSC66845.1 DUF6221 family protein [Streptomyces anulatus]